MINILPLAPPTWWRSVVSGRIQPTLYVFRTVVPICCFICAQSHKHDPTATIDGDLPHVLCRRMFSGRLCRPTSEILSVPLSEVLLLQIGSGSHVYLVRPCTGGSRKTSYTPVIRSWHQAHRMKNVPMLRDNHRVYAFFAFPDTSAENAAWNTINKATAFAVSKSFTTDKPSQFKKKTVCLSAKGVKVEHHFTHPYSPWGNGVIDGFGQGTPPHL